MVVIIHRGCDIQVLVGASDGGLRRTSPSAGGVNSALSAKVRRCASAAGAAAVAWRPLFPLARLGVAKGCEQNDTGPRDPRRAHLSSAADGAVGGVEADRCLPGEDGDVVVCYSRPVQGADDGAVLPAEDDVHGLKGRERAEHLYGRQLAAWPIACSGKHARLRKNGRLQVDPGVAEVCGPEGPWQRDDR